MKKIWTVLGIAFVILVMSGFLIWEHAHPDESIPEEPIVVDTNSAPILFTPYELQAYHGYRGGIDLVCMPDSADANDCLVPYSTAPLLDNRFERMEQMIEAMYAVICEVPEPPESVAIIEGYLRWDHDGDENLEIYTGKEWISTGVKP